MTRRRSVRRDVGERDVDPSRPEVALDIVRRAAGHVEGDDRALHCAAVEEGHAGHLGQPGAEPAGEADDALPAGLDSQLERVVDRDAEPDLAGVVRLPVLEAPRVRADACNGRAPSTRPSGGRGTAARAPRAACGAPTGSRCRAGRGGTCGRSRRAGRSRSPRRRWASGRPTGRRRAGTGHPPRAPRAPTSAAGLTRPLSVGHVGDETASRASSSIARSARRRRAGRARRRARPRRRAGARGDLRSAM